MDKTVHSAAYRQILGLLRARREELGLSMRDLGEILKVPHSVIGKIELAERRLDLLEYTTICEALDLDPRELLGPLLSKKKRRRRR